MQVVDEFLHDLRASADAARGKTPPPMVASLAGLRAQDIGDDVIAQLWAMAGVQGGGALPARMAEINHVLNVLPAELKERLLVQFVNDLFA